EKKEAAAGVHRALERCHQLRKFSVASHPHVAQSSRAPLSPPARGARPTDYRGLWSARARRLSSARGHDAVAERYRRSALELATKTAAIGRSAECVRLEMPSGVDRRTAVHAAVTYARPTRGARSGPATLRWIMLRRSIHGGCVAVDLLSV